MPLFYLSGRKEAGAPWYERGLFWGFASTAVALVLVVVAAMFKDLRWLLPIAWLSWWGASSVISRAFRKRGVQLVVFAVLIAGSGYGLWTLYRYSPKQLLVTSDKASKPVTNLPPDSPKPTPPKKKPLQPAKQNKGIPDGAERAYLHVELVKVTIVTAENNFPYAIDATISGRNASATATSRNPLVYASISLQPYIETPEEEREKLIVKGNFNGHTLVPFNDVFAPYQPFSFTKRDAVAFMNPESNPSEGDPFHDNWNAFVRGDVVLYVVTAARYSDKWGLRQTYSCHEFYWNKQTNQIGQGICVGAYQ